MDSKDLQNLQEAYMEVYQLNELTPADIFNITSREIYAAKKIASDTNKKRKSKPKKNNSTSLKNEPKNEELNIYDIILEHLVQEGYANNLESAEVILENMSEDWMESIIEGFVDPETGEAPSGRSPLENVSYNPKKSVRRKAMGAFAYQMGKEYGGKWKAKTKDPTKDN